MIAKQILTAFFAATTIFLSVNANGQTYPQRLVRLVVPYGPGTAVDITARYIADRLAQTWGKPVIVENKAGAAGIIGTEMVARAAPDGYTLLFTGAGHVSNVAAYAKLPYDPIKDFQPIVRASSSYMVLVVAKASPVNSMSELIGYIRARPGQIYYGSAGTGNMTHLAANQVVLAAGVSAVNVPYKTHSQALVDTLGGQVFMTFVGLATALPHIASGAVKPLAVTGLKRSRSLPNVPTLDESGLSGVEVVSKLIVLGPTGTPAHAVQRISEAIMGIARSSEFSEFVVKQGLEPDVAPPDVLARDLPVEIELWRNLFRSSGVEPQ